MREVDRLRAEAKALRRRTTAKIGRIRRTYDTDISETYADPRENSTAIDQMNSRQLRAYIRKNVGFLSRDVGYVQGANGLLPANLWKQHEQLRLRFNKIADANHATFADKKLPGSINTVDERDKIMRDRLTMRQAAMNRPLQRIERSSTEIASERALKTLIRDLKKRLEPGFKEKAMKAGRKQSQQMLKKIGSKHLSSFVKNLDDETFEFMWFYGNLAETLKARYTGIEEAAIHRLDKGFANVTAEIAQETISDWQATINSQGFGTKV